MKLGVIAAKVGDKIIVTTLIQNIDKIYDLLER